MAAPRPSWHDLGLNRLAYGCLAAQAVVLALTVVIFRAYGLSIVLDHQTVVKASLPAICFLIWMSFVILPGPRRAWITAEAALAFFLLNAITWIVAPGQYGALAIGRPFIDEILARGDAAIGIDVSSVVAWTNRHPGFLAVLNWAYGTLSPQVLFAIPIMRLLRERDAMWEFVFHFHFCLIVTLVASAFWPVAGPYQWFSYATPLDLTRIIAQVNGFHDGTLTVVRWAELDGLISNPSFHTSAALFAIWAARTRWWLLAPMTVVNSLLILATFMTGIHYLMDTLAGSLVFVVSLLAYRAAERRHLLRDPRLHMAHAYTQGPATILVDDRVPSTASASSSGKA